VTIRLDHPYHTNPYRRLDTIALRHLEFRCIIGLYHRERLEAQPLEMDLELYLNINQAVAEHSLTYSVDYAALVDELNFLLQCSRFELLETAGQAICHFLLAYQPRNRSRAIVDGVRLWLRKPKALKGMAYPELVMERHQEQIQPSILVDRGIRNLHHNANCTLLQVDMRRGESFSYHGRDLESAFAFCWAEGFLIEDEQLLQVGSSQSLPRKFRLAVDDSCQQILSLFLIVRVDGASDPNRDLPVINFTSVAGDQGEAVLQ